MEISQRAYHANPHRFDVDITSLRQRLNFDKFSRHFQVLFWCNFADRKITSFLRTFSDVISMVEKSTLFLHTFFDVISMVEKSTLFLHTFFDVISMVEKSTLFPRTFFDVIFLVKVSTLFLPWSVSPCFYLFFRSFWKLMKTFEEVCLCL